MIFIPIFNNKSGMQLNDFIIAFFALIKKNKKRFLYVYKAGIDSSIKL